MATLLNDFPVDMKSRVTPTESGFQILSGSQRLRFKVLPGNAIGWEHGSACWLGKRDEWIKAVQAAPRCAQAPQDQNGGSGSRRPFDVGPCSPA